MSFDDEVYRSAEVNPWLAPKEEFFSSSNKSDKKDRKSGAKLTDEEIAWKKKEEDRIEELRKKVNHTDDLNVLSNSVRLQAKVAKTLADRFRNRKLIRDHKTEEELDVRRDAIRMLRYVDEQNAEAEAILEAKKPKPKQLDDKLEPKDKAYHNIMDNYVETVKRDREEEAIRKANLTSTLVGSKKSILPNDLRKIYTDWSKDQSSLPKWLRPNESIVSQPLIVEDKPTNIVCPLCNEYMFHPPGQIVCFVACGHGMHMDCKKTLMRAADETGNKKPICLICSTPIRFEQLDQSYTYTVHRSNDASLSRI